MKKLTGLIAATFTPMDGAGQVNLEPIPSMVERLLHQGIQGFYVCGSTGEGPSLSNDERKQVAAAFVEATQGRVPVVVQVGHNCLEDARHLAAHAEAIGADAISAVAPSYFLPENLSTLLDIFSRITDAVPSMPFYYYHIPQLSRLTLNPLAFLEAAATRLPSMVGIKFSSRDIEVMQQCRAFENGRYNVLFGVDEMLLSGLAAGCDGAVGSTYNFLAPWYHEVMASLEKGDLPRAQEAQRKVVELVTTIVRYHGISGLKTAMSWTGIPCGSTRLPLTPLSPEEQTRLRTELEALGFFALAEGARP